MYITTNSFDVNFHVEDMQECDAAYIEVVKTYLQSKGITSVNWIIFCVREELPKKHGKKRIIYLDRNGNKIEATSKA